MMSDEDDVNIQDTFWWFHLDGCLWFLVEGAHDYGILSCDFAVLHDTFPRIALTPHLYCTGNGMPAVVRLLNVIMW